MNIFYADGFSLTGSLVDAKLDFSFSEPVANEQGEISGERQVLGQRVVLALPLAKELVGKLSELIKIHEDQFGQIADLGKMKEKISNNGQ